MHRGAIDISHDVLDAKTDRAWFADGSVTELSEVTKVDRHKRCTFAALPVTDGVQRLRLIFDRAVASPMFLKKKVNHTGANTEMKAVFGERIAKYKSCYLAARFVEAE